MVVCKSTPEWQTVVTVRKLAVGLNFDSVVWAILEKILQIYFVTCYLSTLKMFPVHFEFQNDFSFNGYWPLALKSFSDFVCILKNAIFPKFVEFRGISIHAFQCQTRNIGAWEALPRILLCSAWIPEGKCGLFNLQVDMYGWIKLAFVLTNLCLINLFN